VFISVIVPVFNGASFLEEAVACVRAQDYPSLEILIVDDGSTDRTPQVARAFGEPVRYFRQENRGPSGARNTGLRQARGEAIAFLDADDLWPEDKLRSQADYLKAHPDVEAVHGLTQIMKPAAGGQETMCFEAAAPPRFILAFGGALIRREVFDRVGLMDEELGMAEDVNWLLRLFEKDVRLVVLNRVTSIYRRHPRGMSFYADLKGSCLLKEIKKSLDRRREGAGRAPDLPDLLFEGAGAANDG